MQKTKTLLSISIIENTIRNDSLHDVKASNLIISIAINQIEDYNKDKYVKKVIQEIFREWKIYSGLMNYKGRSAGQNRELEHMFVDCENIRHYLNNLKGK
jgi:hypothetical protein